MSIKIDDDSLFDVPALATALGIKEKTVRKILGEGHIKGKKNKGESGVSQEQH